MRPQLRSRTSPVWTRQVRLSMALSLGLATSALIGPALDAKVVDRVVAVVNDDVITLSELQELIIPVQMRLQSIADPLKRAELLREPGGQRIARASGHGRSSLRIDSASGALRPRGADPRVYPGAWG